MNCGTCKHWRGDEHQYNAVCGKHHVVMAFNDTCPDYAAKIVIILANKNNWAEGLSQDDVERVKKHLGGV
jgi:hypothetical protein